MADGRRGLYIGKARSDPPGDKDRLVLPVKRVINGVYSMDCERS